mmetsp:Transcript_4100/g.4477  ORF Transcript_4100/g.4477 Transcript_4100/m.4477 type:complete len:376 (-) Transcript_4100:567-1694(-)|eukprot:CAMPEP_0194355990 /NCGR_PEP_ID=MMETSP0174-20130528/3817_1 /TAXON_ID=216777 /ORGANISM="Proboscia alata, Strain PI-D3" /LENGTH=375 /DNA_ID=CAMNT_0039125489 /DNA_START=174 /DNA_END=1301 /DNA_ORIENTATION=-
MLRASSSGSSGNRPSSPPSIAQGLELLIPPPLPPAGRTTSGSASTSFSAVASALVSSPQSIRMRRSRSRSRSSGNVENSPNSSSVSPRPVLPSDSSLNINLPSAHDSTAAAPQAASPRISSRRRRNGAKKYSSRSSAQRYAEDSQSLLEAEKFRAQQQKQREQMETEDSMVWLDGPLVYACGQCRTHLTSHDDIISKSFHGRHGRAYLFDQCVNVTTGTAEDRLLITGMHSVCDIFCNRCRSMVGWTYARAYEPSQKYKEGKFIIEKINLHLEESDAYDVCHPAGERHDKWRRRSMSWGSESPVAADLVYEYKPKPALLRARSGSIGKTGNSPGGLNAGSPPLRAESVGTSSVSPSINMSGRNIKSPPTSHADRP